MKNFNIGDVVRLRTCKEYPIGGWVHGELAVICGGSYESQTLFVRLKNRTLRNAVEQDGAIKGTIVVSFANVRSSRKNQKPQKWQFSICSGYSPLYRKMTQSRYKTKIPSERIAEDKNWHWLLVF